MANTKKNEIRYINETTALVTKAFQKNAVIFGTEEFKLWREYLAFCPNAKMTTKSIKKNENQKRRRNKKYENMEAFINTQPNAKELMKEFETIKERSKIQSSPYQYVLDWFEKKFEGYDELDEFLAAKDAERKAKEAEKNAASNEEENN